MVIELSANSHLRGREPPDIPGVTQSDGEWQLDLDYYRSFITDVTGIDAEDDLSTDQVKTIQTRLEGCIERYRRDGICLCDDLDRYEYVDSMEVVHELSRFFRALVASRVETPEFA